MHSSSILTLAFAVLASAQTPASSAVIPQASLDAASQCATRCDPSDVNCLAACVGVPYPNGSQADGTTQCAAKCPQGDGSASDTDKYSDCVQGCISSIFFPISGATAPATGFPVMATSDVPSNNVASATVSAPSMAASGANSAGNGASSPAATGTTGNAAGAMNSNSASRTAASSTATGTGAAGAVGPNVAGLIAAIAAVAAL